MGGAHPPLRTLLIHYYQPWKYQIDILTVNGICLFWQLNGILSDVGIHKEARNKKRRYIWLGLYKEVLAENKTSLVCKIQTKSWKSWFLKMQLPGLLTSRNFSGGSVLTSQINLEIFRSISQRLAILQNSL